MTNNNLDPLKVYAETFCKEHGIKVNIDELVKHIYNKARSMSHNANCIAIDNAEIDQWIIDSPNEMKKEKEKKEKKAETKKTEVKEEKKDTPKNAYKWTPKKKEVVEEVEEEEETEEEVVIEQLDLF